MCPRCRHFLPDGRQHWAWRYGESYLNLAPSETPACMEAHRAGAVRPHVSLMPDGGRWAAREGESRNPCMYGHEESDSFIVPKSLANKGGDNKPPAESREGRSGLLKNTKQDDMPRTQSRIKARAPRNGGGVAKGMFHGLQRVRKVARQGRDIQFNGLMHHITPETLKGSYGRA